jgi:hypothetical protein
VGLGDAVDEVLEEMVNGELSLREIHAFRGELGDGISNVI